EKLRQGEIRKVLLMYPTIALMNDQRRVMDELARLTGQQVGHIQGGMHRSALIAQLNKPVIVATPDAIYWFFQKNVKYSGLMIYGLSLIDEVVLDEAHLFNGLALRNIFHLKQRMTQLAAMVGRSQRWHILTATPTEQLKELSAGAKIVTGRSKCGPVQVTFLPPPQKREDRATVLTQAVTEALQNGANKVLLVFNSAAAAHGLFDKVRGKQPDLPVELLQRFGMISWEALRQWLTAENINSKTITAIANWVEREGPYHLIDLKAGTKAEIPAEKLVAKTGQILHYLGRQIRNAAYAAGPDLLQDIERQLRQQNKAVQALWQPIQSQVAGKGDLTPDMVKQTLNNYLTNISQTLETSWADEAVSVTAPDFPELTSPLKQAGLALELANYISRRLQYTLELDDEAARSVQISQKVLDKRPVALRWLSEQRLIEDKAELQVLQAKVAKALQENRLPVETRHIATWGETGIPAVIYTGQMSRRDREGLIEVFDDDETLPRAVLVSTPAVEVGVDFKAEVMVTEECNGNGFLQRFGRVGRTGQGQARVIVLLNKGQTWVQLQQRSHPQMSREDFSTMIIDPQAPTDPARSLFPDRTYAAFSIYQEATHWLVNQQMGRIGQQLNTHIFSDPLVAGLGRQMIEADVSFAYGLRGSMPGVSLLGGNSNNPFYVFSKVENGKLIASNSPFEIAQAQVGYTAFLYTKAHSQIVADLKKTLAAGQVMYYWLDGRWHMATGYGITESYKDGYLFFRNVFKSDMNVMRQKLNSPNPRAQAVARLGEALNLLETPHANLILGQGDVFLERRDKKAGYTIGPVEDYLDTPLVLPDQLWLHIIGDANEIRARLSEAGLDDLSEVHYPPDTEDNILLLDQVAGGCFYIYERLVADAAR
ncbi:MAG: DEAD/DEAH box helicase, partial [Chloroflexi bacterium]